MFGGTALHVAAKYAQFEICELLLAHGADPLALDYNNRTPLHEVTHNAESLFSKQDSGVQGCKPWETCRAILNAGGYEILIENTDILEHYNGPTASEFRVLHLN
jgi:ankyrin repeat protein